MNSKNFLSDFDHNVRILEGAYRKLKSYYYYNKSFIFIRDKIAKFESDPRKMEETFACLANCLCHPRSNCAHQTLNELLSQIDFFVIPKKFESNPSGSNRPVTNTIQRDKKMKTVNFFIDAPIEVFILDTLWTVFLAKVDKTNHVLSYDVYGNTINNSSLFHDDNPNFDSRILFNRYFVKYSDWRNNAFDVLGWNYSRKQDSVLVSLDIQSYYYSVAFNVRKIDGYFGDSEVFDDIRPLTLFMDKVFSKYLDVIKPYRKDLTHLKKDEYPLPIGLLSSMVLANIYLSKFDKAIKNIPGLMYYGRYVDDILLVFGHTIDPSQTTASILKELLVDKKVLSEHDNQYQIVGYPNLRIQGSKIKVIYIDHKESKAILDIYNDTIRIIPSQMSPIPETDLSLASFDENAYSIENFSKQNRLRDVGQIGVDSFKVARFFSSLAHRYAHVNSMTNETARDISNHITQIEKFFSGSQSIEFYTNWLNYMYFLVITQRKSSLRYFLSNTKKYIRSLKGTSLDRNIYKNTATLNKKAKDALSGHLDVCLMLALSLDIDTAENHFHQQLPIVHTYMRANMFNHNLVAFPLSNYLENDKYVSYTKLEISGLGRFPKSIEDSFLFKWSPRFIHYDELLLLLFYHHHRQNQANEPHQYAFNSLMKRFVAVNHLNYKPFNISNVKEPFGKDYSLYEIGLPNGHRPAPQNLHIAVGSVNISNDQCMDGCERWKNIRFQDKEVINTILKDTYGCFKKEKRDPKILVLPELCFPIYWIGELITFAKRSQIAIVTGLQYIKDSDGRVYNYIATILPYTTGTKKYRNTCVHIREKNDYSPIEFEGLAKLGYHCKNKSVAEYFIYNWSGISLSPLVCFELTDVIARAIIKGKCNVIAASVFNPDTTYFSNIIDSTARDLHSFIIQANTSFYGDSRVTGPYDRDSKDIFKIKGGDNDHVVVGTLSFKKVIEYQDNYYNELQKRIDEIEFQRHQKKPQYPKRPKNKPDIKPLSARYHK